ncbi:hypothetical protein [Adhaeribacter soli]|uniref:6-bladed beta-propeller n=1 Tax=Adhaeribacter soli TaxID=2607655 RepID=A0A5N1IS69_9BACT|nr:hypothetical protein [Adhaeribacter soli]KAA9331186.1 hypothetical protein F0P94_14950 [Adhaeribacter soli]
MLFPALLLAFLLATESRGQTIALRQHLDVAQPAAMSLDRMNNIYLTDRKNNLHQYIATGRLVNTYSPARNGHIGNVEAWNGMKVMLFYDDQQQITLLDRFLNNISTIRLRDYTEGSIKVATTTADDRLWLFNETEFSLLKFDPRSSEVVSTTQLGLTLNRKQSDVRFIREYQNMVYLVDKTTGIYVFDNLGNYKKTLPFPELSYIGFKGDELYYLKGGKLHFFNLYSFAERSFDVPPVPAYRQALVGEELIYLLSDSGLDLYAFE